ncbi:MAG: UDP-N-acetylglucosamine--N-acetylmuramyl-(pentapeptide) pyrophosphoryl-undecaprenol N-acetylglucosamine transferase [Patescibacteria group bacterium]|nr:UDP-N-acetylglucosamine--N-acetylmuramyl-(pentapeptide) pyrophosphoryl-undecaprenol N-acetylglucosamine transferase [Patescibacteria group bacterium]
MKILLTGGGTAGHAWPVIMVGRSLQKNKRVQLLYVGSRQGIEKKLSKDFQIPFKAILSGKRRTYFSLSNFWDLFKIFCGIIQAFFIILFFRPDVVFAKGGYVTVPIIFWVRFFKIPLVIHESDVVMGRANLWAANFARKICLGFPLEYYTQKLPVRKLIYTGIPVNPEFIQTSIKDEGRPKILITGGSQGSSKINNLISEILPELINRFEIWHLSGQRDFEKLQNLKNPYYHLFDFSYQMPKFMRDADLIISRAGASTLTEIAATGIPSIIIPLETAANEHQEANAQVFQKMNAAVVVSEKNLTANSLKTIIDHLMDDEKTRALLGHHAKSFFRPDAAEEIINTLFEVAKK